MPFTIGGLAKATFIGAASAAVTFGIGSAASSMFSTPAMGFWQGAYQGAVIGSLSGAGGAIANAAFTGSSLTLKAVLGGAVIGGAVGGIQGGASASNQGLDYWSGEGQTIDFFEMPVNALANGQHYASTSEMRADYNTNIGSVDNLSLGQIESKLNTNVSLASNTNLPKGSTIKASGLIDFNGKTAAGLTRTDYSGDFFTSPSSRILISPGLKGYNLNIRNMVFKHEFMHAWHWNSGMANYSKYTERATSAYSLYYTKQHGEGWLSSLYRNNIGNYPRIYSWRNFNKIVPLWVK